MTSKTLTVIDPQLLSGSGDVTRTALGLSVDGGDLSSFLSTGYEVSSPVSIADGIKQGYVYDIRMAGNEDHILNDKHWLSYVNGGVFSEQQYPGIYSDNTFFDHYHTENTPYTEIETRQNGTYDTMSPNYISCKPQINNYYRLFEQSNRDITDIKELPNIYKLTLSDDLPDEYRLGTVQANQTSSLLENIFVTSNDATNIYDEIETINNQAHLIPYYVRTTLNTDATGFFVSGIYGNGFQHRFMKILKDCFLSQDGANNRLSVPFTLKSEALDINKDVETASDNVNLAAVDVFDMLNYSLTDYNTEVDNFNYLLDDSETAASQYDKNSVRRFEKTLPTIKQTTSLLTVLTYDLYKDTFIDSPLHSMEKHNEVVAYRIEKIGGQVTGDSFTQNTLQNFWFLNRSDLETLDFIDNQVVFNGDYTYRIYKYVLVAGIEYTYSDLAVTRTIADLDPNWCLEFFNPTTGESSSPIFDDSTGAVQAIEDLGNTLAGDAQVQSTNKYLADFKLTVMPSIKIVEVPLMTKEISIVDAPPNSVNIKPSFILDNSNRLEFFVRYDTKIPSLFPTPITTADIQYKQKFMNSYDVMDGDLITDETGTLPTTLEIYRIKEKPTSMASFDGNLLTTKSMKIPNEDAAHSTVVCYDMVVPNTKYYYLFRIVNEAGNGGLNSIILEAELVSDGGYKFANFNTFFENELEERSLSRTLKSFKKLLTINPTIDNVIVNDSAADYSDSAINQINNVEFGQSDNPIWGKKFKIRLTSKKTGKKIDINITHKLVG
jgi:hypothetical protein